MDRDYIEEMKVLMTDMLQYSYSLEGEEKEDFTRELDTALDELYEFSKTLVK